MKTVLLAGSNPARTRDWHEALQADGGWQVLGPVHSFAAARPLLHRHDPALLVSDLRLADGTLLDMIRILRTGTAPLRTQVLVAVKCPDDPLLLDALQEGADNFHDSADDRAAPLVDLARETLEGGAEITPWIAHCLLDHFGGNDEPASPIEEMINPLALTAGERWLLRQLSGGRRLGEVARLEDCAPRELAARVRAIYRKMQWALRAGNLTLQVA